jgi:hypothetical protein
MGVIPEPLATRMFAVTDSMSIPPCSVSRRKKSKPAVA